MRPKQGAVINNRALIGYPGTRPKDLQNRVPVKFQTPNSIPLFPYFTELTLQLV